MDDDTRTRVLIIEDETLLGFTLEENLRDRGFEALSLTGRFDEVMKRTPIFKPDVALVDINLDAPRDGVDLAVELSDRFDLPVIFLTAYSDWSTVRRAFESNPYGYVVKPYETTQLTITIDLALRRYHLERELDATTIRFRQLFQAASLAMFLVDAGGNVTDTNPAAARFFARTCGDIDPKTAFATIGEHLDLAAAGTNELEIAPCAGTVMTVRVSTVPLATVSVTHLQTVVIVEDITEDRNRQRATETTRDALRFLFIREESIRKREREHIARELHDEIGQRLTALKIDLHRATSNRETPRNVLVSAQEQIEGIITASRSLVRAVRDSTLSRLGLEASVRDMIDSIQGRTGLAIDLKVTEVDTRLPSEVESAAYRIVQECLTNVVRHASAVEVSASIRREADTLYLDVADDGIGLPPDRPEVLEGNGLIGIRERVVALNGTICFESNDGFAVHVALPVTPIAEEGVDR